MKKLDSSSIAVLMTCHNRKEKTVESLSALFDSGSKANQYTDVYLVDDGSTDGTSLAVKAGFPEVNVIDGDGSLFWNGGMRLAWQHASGHKDYDFFLWLNDDTILFDFAISQLIDNYTDALKKDGSPALIVGSCKNSFNSNEFSYGGRSDSAPVAPNGEIQTCKYVNGNVVLVPNEIHKVLGNLSDDYTHAMGDIDYGLRAIKNGFSCYVTKKYIAVCPVNEVPSWYDPQIPLKRRWKLLHSPKGLNIKEYNKFRKKFWGSKWLIFALKAYLRALIPSTYNLLSKN